MLASTTNKGSEKAVGSFPMQTKSLHGSLLYTSTLPRQVLTQRDNQPLLQQLLSHWSQAQPIAGPDYWATRVWTLIVWQPIYLSICAAHIGGHFVNVKSVSQCVQGSVVMGYGLNTQAFAAVGKNSQSPLQLLASIAAPLRELVDHLYGELNGLIKLNKANAYGLVADCVMHALLALMDANPKWQQPQIISLAENWCEQLGLINRKGLPMSQLVAVKLDNQQSVLTLERKACCKHYLVDPRDPCSNCSRLSWQQRLQRLNSEI